MFLLICQKLILMKKIFLITVLIAFVSCQKENTSKNTLLLSGKIEGLKNGTLYIQRLKDTALIPIDTIVFKGKSTFETKLNLDSPEMLYLFLDRGVTNSIDDNLPFFAEPGKMEINTTLDFFASDAKITGSKNQKLFEEYKKGTTQYNNANLDLIKEKIELLKKDHAANTTVIDMKQQDLIGGKYLYAVNFAVNHKYAEIAPYIAIYEVPNINTKYLDTIAHALPKNISNSFYGKQLKSLISEREK